MLEKEASVMITHRIEQYISTMNMLENIRWRFIASFGLGAFIALFLNATGSHSDKATLAGILTIIVSIAGIVSQIRVYGLILEAWFRIRILQTKEFSLLFEENDSLSDVEESLVFPMLDSGKYRNAFTVHMATCLVFSVLIGTSVYLIVRAYGASYLSVLIGVFIGTGFVMLSYYATSKYLTRLESEREKEK